MIPRISCGVILLLAFGCGRGEPRGRLPVAPVGVVRDKVKMVSVPAGYFIRGRKTRPGAKTVPGVSGSKNKVQDNSPERRIYVDAFQIDQFEVTNEAYSRFVSEMGRPPPTVGRSGQWSRFAWEGRRPPPGAGDLPVTLVTWFDAEAYCAWAGKRLPTEAEWEKAARGPDGQAYPWGDTPASGAANLEKRYEGPLPGGSFPADRSPYGAIDMAGNVSEWVHDYYDPAAYARSAERNPTGPPRGSLRVVRGGFWRDPLENGRADRRWNGIPSARHGGVGFRCALSGGGKN